jgi:hypothetical protein
MTTNKIEMALIAAILAFSFVAESEASRGNGGVSGGDPIAVQAQAFPDSEKLRAAVFYLQQKISESAYSTQLKSALSSELTKLHEERKFLFIPEMIILGHSRFEGDYKTLVSSGAFTTLKPGDPIYFSKQVVNYTAEQLARVIAQELPHHVLTGEQAADEAFVNNFGAALIEGRTERALSEQASLALPSTGQPLSCENVAKSRSGNPDARKKIRFEVLSRLKNTIRVLNGTPNAGIVSDERYHRIIGFPQPIHHYFRVAILKPVIDQNADRTFHSDDLWSRCMSAWASDRNFDANQTIREVWDRISSETLACICGL